MGGRGHSRGARGRWTARPAAPGACSVIATCTVMTRSDRITRFRSRRRHTCRVDGVDTSAASLVGAVEKLSVGTAIDPRSLHELTAGNPFFVTEVIAAGGGHVPSTVREAVCACQASVGSRIPQIVRAAAVLGRRCDVEVLGEVAAANPEDIDNCIAGGMLRRQHSTESSSSAMSWRA